MVLRVVPTMKEGGGVGDSAGCILHCRGCSHVRYRDAGTGEH